MPTAKRTTCVWSRSRTHEWETECGEVVPDPRHSPYSGTWCPHCLGAICRVEDDQVISAKHFTDLPRIDLLPLTDSRLAAMLEVVHQLLASAARQGKRAGMLAERETEMQTLATGGEVAVKGDMFIFIRISKEGKQGDERRYED